MTAFRYVLRFAAGVVSELGKRHPPLYRAAATAEPRARLALFVAALLGILPESASAPVTISKNSNTNWTVSNGLITMVFDPSADDVTSVQLGSGTGASPNLLGGSTAELDEEFAGTPFGAGPQTFASQAGPSNSYQDVWTSTASSGTANPITYSFHYLVFNSDPTIYCYEALSHAATDAATSVGQGQFLFRSNPSLFPNLYQINTGPNQLGTSAAVTTLNVPSTNSNFGTVGGVAGRQVQNATVDLTGSGIPGDNGTNFFTKYDYSVYTQFYQAETMYGSQYAVTEVNPSPDTLTGGPTEQELAWTDPAILNMEFLSDHYGINGSGSGAYPGYAYYPTQGVNTTKLFGPYGFRVSSSTAATAAAINTSAINAIPASQAEFDADAELAANGYVPTTSRGTFQVSVSSTAGWSAEYGQQHRRALPAGRQLPGINARESVLGPVVAKRFRYRRRSRAGHVSHVDLRAGPMGRIPLRRCAGRRQQADDSDQRQVHAGKLRCRAADLDDRHTGSLGQRIPQRTQCRRRGPAAIPGFL